LIKICQFQNKNGGAIKQAIRGKYALELKSKFSGSKLMQGPFKDETFEIRDCIHQMNLSDARTNCKMNQRFNPVYAKNLWKCDACQNLDMQSHLMWCPAYATLREGLDIDCDKDVVLYF
jgi:hypothetical protein